MESAFHLRISLIITSLIVTLTIPTLTARGNKEKTVEQEETILSWCLLDLTRRSQHLGGRKHNESTMPETQKAPRFSVLLCYCLDAYLSLNFPSVVYILGNPALNSAQRRLRLMGWPVCEKNRSVPLDD